MMWLYRVRNMPVFRQDHYQSICNDAQYVAWDHNQVLLYGKEEINRCKDLGYLLVCKKARNIEKLRVSCLYSLAKTLSPKCNYTTSKVEDIQFILKTNIWFITFHLERSNFPIYTVTIKKNRQGNWLSQG